MTIDFTMFAVGLGTSILMQFSGEKRPIRILVDGGDAKAGKKVAVKLAKRFSLEAETEIGQDPCIDLVIGSHYDADHLDGLTEIVKHVPEISIGQIWLPPVADDTDLQTFGRVPREEDMLSTHFSGEHGQSAFENYLNAKQERLEKLDRYEEVFGLRPERANTTEGEDYDTHIGPNGLINEALRPFHEAYWTAKSMLGSRGLEHAPDLDIIDDTLFEALLDIELWLGGDGPFGQEFFHSPEAEQSAILRLAIATSRMKTAKDGINAGALRRLIVALDSRKGIKRRHKWCEDARPLIVGWNQQSGEFDGHSVGTGSPTLTILGPTERIIAERRDALPRLTMALFFATSFRQLKWMSNSNQLSYVVRADHEGQGILITGDSGFDGFSIKKDSANKYEKLLTKHLRDLAVIQVPHHGGISRHFFRIMDRVGFAQTIQKSYLLLSHERNSAHRPGTAFASFMSHIGQSHPTRLLFTATPRAENVKNYKILAEPPTPAHSGEGDVEIRYTGSWSVIAHQVKL